MKIATFNVENLFERAKVFNETNTISSNFTKKFTELSNLLELPAYSADNKTRIKKLLIELGLEKSDEGEFLILRQNRGKLLSRPKNKPLEIVANGRPDWIGWLDLKTQPVNAIAIRNTAQVIRDVNADIMVVIEAEHRIALKQYNDVVLPSIQGQSYEQIMVIDGNDTRGIDVGIMTKAGFSIELMKSHIHDKLPNGRPLFSRDCPEYQIITPTGQEIWVLPNHFKSKFGGNDDKSQEKRLAQAQKVKEIYEDLINEGKTNIVVLGDLNDTPDSSPLNPLLQGTNLRDVSTHPSFSTGRFPGKGTFGLGNDNNKIDYILLSPSLFALIRSCGLFRKGAWPGKSPQRWDVYPELQEEIHAASDHHLVWVDLNI